jgi:hypothetical protein
MLIVAMLIVAMLIVAMRPLSWPLARDGLPRCAS